LHIEIHIHYTKGKACLASCRFNREVRTFSLCHSY
jgi:hypothetical protein